MRTDSLYRRMLLAPLAVILGGASATLGAVAPAAASSISIEETPITVDSTNSASWWTPIVQHNGSTYVAYLDDDLNAVVAKRDPSGVWTQEIVDTGVVPDPGHTQASLAIDGDGYIHSAAGLLGRYSSSGYYWLRLHSSHHRVELYRYFGGVIDLLAFAPVSVTVDEWYDLELEMVGTTITGSVDGVPLVSVNDGAVSAGRAGARSYKQSFAIDDVVVTTS